MMQDIATVTGATFFTEDLGVKLESVDLNDLGRAKKVKIDKENTTIIEGKGTKDAIKGRISQIRNEIEKSTSDWDKEKLQERLAKLAGGVAVLKVGASTETELKEKKHRYEDALEATRAAVEEGIVAGGGVALLRAIPVIFKDNDYANDDERLGARIVERALQEPARMIAANAGQEGSIVVERIFAKKEKNYGYNAATHKYEDLVKAGIIDPVKVTRSALQNAASIASMLLTTEALVSEKPEEKPATPQMPGGGGMGMDY